MKKFAVALLLLLSVSAISWGQGIINPYRNKHVTVTGNSIAQMQGGFQSQEFPLVPPGNVLIRGQNSYTCSMILTLITYLVPVNTDVVVLIDSTNDAARNIRVDDHMACIRQTITTLTLRNPAIKIVVANTPPWGEDTCDGQDPRATIAAYNAAYADASTGLEASYRNVKVADVWTPAVQDDGWAIPQYMQGSCHIHPDIANQWTSSWSHFSYTYDQLVMSALRGQW